MINRTVLMSDAHHFTAEQAINPYYFDSHTDQQKAQEEHDSIREALMHIGVEVLTTDSPIDSQDGVYTANWALVRGDTAVLARLPNVRRSEEVYAERVLKSLGKTIVHVPDGLKFSGQGDALACGEYLFCGRNYRSDEAAQAFAANALGYKRVQLETIPQLDISGQEVINPVSGWADSMFYDIDLALAVIRPVESGKNGLIAYCPDAFSEESQQIVKVLPNIDRIEISLEEATTAFAGNLVSTGESVVMSADAPRLKTALESRGITVYTPVIHELAKGGGYIRCTTLTLD